MKTHAADIFCEMCEACEHGILMQPRSANDKEYFAQDWFAERLTALSLPFLQQGRNSYPDFWVDEKDDREGFEIKSLSVSNGRPARKDIDFNSTIPSGLKLGNAVFLVFFLYTGKGKESRSIHSISLAHGDFINADHILADEHLNVAIRDFGSYADGFIRNRKMYVFPHPLTIDPEGLGRKRLIVPSAWRLRDKRLTRIKEIDRVIAPTAVDHYTIRLRGRGHAEVERVSADNANQKIRFDVFEAI